MAAVWLWLNYFQDTFVYVLNFCVYNLHLFFKVFLRYVLLFFFCSGQSRDRLGCCLKYIHAVNVNIGCVKFLCWSRQAGLIIA